MKKTLFGLLLFGIVLACSFQNCGNYQAGTGKPRKGGDGPAQRTGGQKVTDFSCFGDAKDLPAELLAVNGDTVDSLVKLDAGLYAEVTTTAALMATDYVNALKQKRWSARPQEGSLIALNEKQALFLAREKEDKPEKVFGRYEIMPITVDDFWDVDGKTIEAGSAGGSIGENGGVQFYYFSTQSFDDRVKASQKFYTDNGWTLDSDGAAADPNAIPNNRNRNYLFHKKFSGVKVQIGETLYDLKDNPGKTAVVLDVLFFCGK